MKSNFTVALNVLFLRKDKKSDVKVANETTFAEISLNNIKMELGDLESNTKIPSIPIYHQIWCTVPLNNLVESATNSLK